jgi:hypothetical protein
VIDRKRGRKRMSECEERKIEIDRIENGIENEYLR